MVNWGQFETKNDGKETTAFEEMIYLLFCSKYDFKEGIFGYVNQPGIEKQPIKIVDECIGFQAKYYTGRLSEHTDDLINVIKTSKTKYPSLTKLEIYTNAEYGYAIGNDGTIIKPKPQVKVEKCAEEQGIKLEWYVKSNLDKILENEENKRIRDKFFGKEKSFLDYIMELNHYSKLILDSINNKIVFDEKEVKIDRNEYIQNMFNCLSEKDILLISGEAGCGKSALVKEFFERKQCYYMMFKVDDFDVDSIQDFFDRFHISLDDFRDFHENLKEKYIFIDSAEKISVLKKQRPIEEFLKFMIRDNWKIIFTSRIDYSNILINNLKINHDLILNEIRLPELDISELDKIFKDNNLIVPNKNIKKYLKNLFNLNFYLSNMKNIDSNDDTEFKNILWEIIIKKSYQQSSNHHEKREQCFLEFVKERCINPQFKYPLENICSEIISEFQRDGIIGFTNNRFFIVHDLYEDLALEKIINNAFIESKGDYVSFLNNISGSLKFNDAFKKWIINQGISNNEEMSELIDYIILDRISDKLLINETILALLQSNNFELFLKKYKYTLLNNDYIFERVAYWLKTVYITEDDSEYSKMIKETFNITLYKPYGKNWDLFISFIYDNLTKITEKQMKVIIPLLLDWNEHYPKSKTTRYSALIAINFYEKIEQNKLYDFNEIEQDVISIILFGAYEIKKELEVILEKILSNNWKRSTDPYYELSMRMLSSDSKNICEVIPNLILKLAKLFWIFDEKPTYYMRDNELFLIDYNTTFNYMYPSAFETPMLILLNTNTQDTIDFIIDFVNITTEHCAKISLKDKEYYYYKPNTIELNINNKKVTQYISNSLWQCYRGTSSPVMPYLLQSIHMALERFLLTECDKGKFEDVEVILKEILSNSHSASSTAVVTSVVLAFPEKFFDIALILFKTIELFMFDANRLSAENQTKGLYGLTSSATENLMINERLNTVNQKFRNTDLESLAIRYQFFSEEKIDEKTSEQRIDSIQKIIDQHKEELKNKKLTKDEINAYKLLLSRIDRRNLTLKTEEKDNQILITFENNNPEDDLKEISNNISIQYNEYLRYVDLNLWAINKLKNKKLTENLIKYDNNLKLVLDKFKVLLGDLANGKDYLEPNNTPLVVSSCLLTFYQEYLNDADKVLCKEVILENISELLFNEDYFYQISDKLEFGINTLSSMFDIFSKDNDFMIIFLLILFNDETAYANKNFCDFATNSLKKLYEIHSNEVNTILCCYSLYKPKFDDIYTSTLKENNDLQYHHNPFALAVKKFLEKYENKLENILEFNTINLENLDLKAMNIIFQIIPNEITLNLHYEFIKNILPLFSKELFDMESSLSKPEHYFTRYLFLNKLSIIILENKNYLDEFISPFLDNFLINDATDQLLYAFSRNVNENFFNEFWDIWWVFLDKFKELPNNISEYYLKKVFKEFIYNYQFRIEDNLTTEIRELEKEFYKVICKEFNNYCIVLDLISDVVIKDKFIISGLNWLNTILSQNDFANVQKSTINNLDIFVKKYIQNNEEKIKENISIQNRLLSIITFLIKNNSSNAYGYQQWLLSIK